MNLTKQAKINALKLESDKWDCVKLFINLLAVCFLLSFMFITDCPEQHSDNAQQAFSSDTGPALYFALPALEGLHKAWTSHLNSPKYAPFHAALTAATDKIHEYYKKSAECDAYIISMCTSISYTVFAFLITRAKYLIPVTKIAISRDSGARICTRRSSKLQTKL